MEGSMPRVYKSRAASVSSDSEDSSREHFVKSKLTICRSASDASTIGRQPIVVLRNKQGMAAIIVPAPPKLATTGTPPPSPTIRKANFTLPNLSAAVAGKITSPPNRAPVRPISQKKPAAKSRRKLGPGCGMLDWIRLCRSGKDLTGTGGEKLTVTTEELALHNTREDCWTAIRGKVYNLTPYFKFHPGGVDDLMRGAGKDCTILFDEAHKWVNVENMLTKCCVGTLATPSPATQKRQTLSITANATRLRSNSLNMPKTKVVIDGMNKQAVRLDKRKNSMELRTQTQAAVACEEPDGMRQISPDSPIRTLSLEIPRARPVSSGSQEATDSQGSLTLPAARPRKNSDATRPNPRFDWVQSEKAINIHVLVQSSMQIKPSDIILDVNGKQFEASIAIGDWIYELNIALAHTVASSSVTITAGRVEISLRKSSPHEQWETIGTFLHGNFNLTPKQRRDTKYHMYKLESVSTVTHDTKLFNLVLPSGSHLCVPTGHHVSVKATVDDEEVVRSYTPVSEFASTRQGTSDSNKLQLMIKLYRNGKMSRFFEQLNLGESVQVSDPEGSFDASRLKNTSNFLLVAAGSGYTPMVNVIKDVAAQKKSHSTKLLFANKTEEDIMWRQEMEQVQSTTAGFEVVHTLSEPSSDWSGTKGRVTKTLLRSHLPTLSVTNSNRTLVCVCGPCQFTMSVVDFLADLQVPDECIHCFT